MTQRYIDLLTRHKVKLLCIRDQLLFDENGATPILTIKNAECNCRTWKNPVVSMKRQPLLQGTAAGVPLPELDAPAPAAPRHVDLIVDIEEWLHSGKGHERWAKVCNLKQMAAALQFVRGHLATEKKALYAKYRTAQQEKWQAVVVKTNIDHLLDVTDGRRNRE